MNEIIRLAPLSEIIIRDDIYNEDTWCQFTGKHAEACNRMRYVIKPFSYNQDGYKINYVDLLLVIGTEAFVKGIIFGPDDNPISFAFNRTVEFKEYEIGCDSASLNLGSERCWDCNKLHTGEDGALGHVWSLFNDDGSLEGIVFAASFDEDIISTEDVNNWVMAGFPAEK